VINFFQPYLGTIHQIRLRLLKIAQEVVHGFGLDLKGSINEKLLNLLDSKLHSIVVLDED
jgi:hypothetical protein